MPSTKSFRVVALVMILGFATLLSGCYGSFNLLRTVYRFNGSIDASADPKINGVVKSLVMVALSVVPVYGIASFADALVVNSIEFWTGQNPVRLQDQTRPRRRAAVYQGDNSYYQSFSQSASGKEMWIEHYRGGSHVKTLVLRHAENSSIMDGDVRWADGRREAYQLTHEGGEIYRISHTTATGERSERLATPAEVRGAKLLVGNILSSPLAMSGPSTIVLR